MVTHAVNTIVADSNPKGKFEEGPISGTPKPGTCMQVKAGTSLDATGHPTWEVFNQSGDGVEALVTVLRETLHGTIDDAYTDGAWGFLYAPIAGEYMMMLVANLAGTGDTISVGDRFMIDDGTGLLVRDSSGDSVPFIAMENKDALTADTHVLMMYTGH